MIARIQGDHARRTGGRPGRRSIAIVLVLLPLLSSGCGGGAHPAAPVGPAGGVESRARFVGRAQCVRCHPAEDSAWGASDHALAMQEAGERTVLGDFNGARFRRDGVVSSFFRRDGRYMVRTDGPDGRLRDYPVRYSFGARPLQQYLVEFPGGRLQALGIAWDARPKAAGGQTWFDLYPGERIAPDGPLHWTGRNQNWNYMCADCHSTDLRPNYDLPGDRYATTWSDINVACEACHGPGSSHLAWASARAGDAPGDPSKGLLIRLGRAGAGSWMAGGAEEIAAHWTGAPRGDTELETCAPCHARRRRIAGPDAPGGRFLDRFMPALLEEGLYFPDGQIQDEVYEYGSFLQSRMQRAGVVCSDCHDPHSLKPRAEGNALCLRCHAAARFDTGGHHHHRTASPGARCVACHMPMRRYMVIDGRRDHGFRVPRPALSALYRTPDPCTSCHADRSDRWAAGIVAGWTRSETGPRAPFAAALDAGRRGRVDAGPQLVALVDDRMRVPAIARATALSLLTSCPAPAALPALVTAIADPEPLVRMAAARALRDLGPGEAAGDLAALLHDPIRAVRVEAARALAAVPSGGLPAGTRASLEAALPELVASEEATAERPESHLNLALVYAGLGRSAEAETELKTALRLDPRWVPAMVNLADLYRAMGRDTEGEPLLARATEIDPKAAGPVEALGLLRQRQGRHGEALDLLARAAALMPEEARFAYAYGIALRSAGRVAPAIRVLERAHARHPADADILAALIGMARERHDTAATRRYLEEMVRLRPDDAEAAALLAGLGRKQAPHD